jgi:hypothetical protein
MFITSSEVKDLTWMDSLPSQRSMVSSEQAFFIRLNELTGVTQREVLADIRGLRIMNARHVAMMALHRRGWNRAQIADFMRRDPSTISNSMATAKKKYEDGGVFMMMVDRLAGFFA